MIRVAFTLLDPATIAARQTVTDEEAQSFYQKNIDRYQGKGGILPYTEVQERVKADTRAFKSARQAYEMAADAINKYKSGDIAGAASSLGVKVAETSLFSATAPAPALAGEPDVVKRAFALKQNELGGPVETKKGIYILKVLEKKPAAVPPLDRIKGQVEAAARDSKAKDLAKQKAEQAIAELAKPNPAVKLQDTGSFSFSPSGDIPKIGKSPQIMDAAFSLTGAAPIAKTAFQIGNVWYAVKLKNRTELNKDAFPKEKEQIKQSLLPKKQQEALNSWIKGLKDKAKVEVNPALLTD
jgi:peptidyl-prolyl cis-trans isomerase D